MGEIPAIAVGVCCFGFGLLTRGGRVAVTKAERAFAESKQAQAEAKYVILALYMKHGLRPGLDEITETGVILRGVNKPPDNLPDENTKDQNE